MYINGAKYNKTADKQTTKVFAILCNICNRAVKGKWTKTHGKLLIQYILRLYNASCKYLISEKKTAAKYSNIQSWDVFIEWSASASNFAFKPAVSACCLDSSSSREVLALWTRAISFCVSDFRFSDSTNIAFVCRCSWVKSSSSFCIFWTSTLPKRCSNLSLRCLIWSLQCCNSCCNFCWSWLLFDILVSASSSIAFASLKWKCVWKNRPIAKIRIQSNGIQLKNMDQLKFSNIFIDPYPKQNTHPQLQKTIFLGPFCHFGAWRASRFCFPISVLASCKFAFIEAFAACKRNISASMEACKRRRNQMLKIKTYDFLVEEEGGGEKFHI